MVVGDLLCRGKVVDHVRRQDGVPQPEGGREHLGKGADVDDAPDPRDVQTGQRRERPLAVAEFAVVVVLDYQRAALPCPLQQRDPSREGQRRSGRVLMRWRDVDQLGAVGKRAEPIDAQSVVIDGHAHDRGAGGREDPSGGGVAGVLDHHGVARLEQESGEEIERLLRAGRHHHSIGAGDNGA